MTDTTPTNAPVNTYAGRLILKAARRYDAEGLSGNTAKDRQIAKARLLAFGEVASDVLEICMTPHGFFMAIVDGLLAHPVPNVTMRNINSSVEIRKTWDADFVTAVLAHDGITAPERVYG